MIAIKTKIKRKPDSCMTCEYIDSIRLTNSTVYHCSALLFLNKKKISNITEDTYLYFMTNQYEILEDCPLIEKVEKFKANQKLTEVFD